MTSPLIFRIGMQAPSAFVAVIASLVLTVDPGKLPAQAPNTGADVRSSSTIDLKKAHENLEKAMTAGHAQYEVEMDIRNAMAKANGGTKEEALGVLALDLALVRDRVQMAIRLDVAVTQYSFDIGREQRRIQALVQKRREEGQLTQRQIETKADNIVALEADLAKEKDATKRDLLDLKIANRQKELAALVGAKDQQKADEDEYSTTVQTYAEQKEQVKKIRERNDSEFRMAQIALARVETAVENVQVGTIRAHVQAQQLALRKAMEQFPSLRPLPAPPPLPPDPKDRTGGALPDVKPDSHQPASKGYEEALRLARERRAKNPDLNRKN